jgi:protoporphyrinogen oxidase
MDGLIVLGAGLSGLGCALHSPGCKVHEASAHVGGHAFSHEQAGVHFDQGAHISHSSDHDFVAMITGAAGAVVEIEGSRVRNYWGGRWVTYPVQNHLHELPVESRIRALTDLVSAHVEGRSSEPADYYRWCLAQYGEYLTENFYKLYTEKYWRVPMADLATDWLGGRILPSHLPRILAGAIAAQEEKQAVFARFRYPARGGFFRFFERLYDDLDVTCGSRAVEVESRTKTVTFSTGKREHYEFLASSIPLPSLVGIIKDVPGHIRDAARALRHTQLLCVNLIVNRPRLTDSHWFYVYDEDIDISRASVPSNLAPEGLDPGSTALQLEIFRRDDEPVPIDVLVERAVSQAARILGFDAARDLRHAGHIHVPRAYILADHHRAAAAGAILQWLQERDIHSMGLYGRWKYMWSDQAYEQGKRTALEIREKSYAAACKS